MRIQLDVMIYCCTDFIVYDSDSFIDRILIPTVNKLSWMNWTFNDKMLRQVIFLRIKC